MATDNPFNKSYKWFKGVRPPATHRHHACRAKKLQMMINYNYYGITLEQFASIKKMRCDRGCARAGDGKCGLWTPCPPPEGYLRELDEKGIGSILFTHDGKRKQ